MRGHSTRRFVAVAVSVAAFASVVGGALVAAPAGAIPGEPLDPCRRIRCPEPQPEPEPQPSGNPFGSLDWAAQWPAGGIATRGWAIDPNTTAPIDVQIHVDGVLVRTVTASLERPDVGAAHPASGSAHGFDVVVPAGLGAHTVCITGVNVGTGANTQIGCKAMDEIVNYEISSIQYHLGQAHLVARDVMGVYSTTVRNGTSIEQSSEISGATTVSESAGWSDRLGFKVSASAGVQVGIPVFSNGEIRVTAEASAEFTWNGSKTWSSTWSWKQPVRVPAYTEVRAEVTLSKSRVSVPYTLTGRYVYRSGATFSGTLDGTYEGVNSHDLTVTLTGSAYPQATATITKTQAA